MNTLKRIRIVLVEPSHPGNIGAVARGMKTMGLAELVLVRPKKFPHSEASKRAVSAEDVLEDAVVVADVASAIKDCSLVLGTSVRDREVAWPTEDPRQAAMAIGSHLNANTDAEKHSVAILFGRESSGLSNAELDLCDMQIRVPANPQYSSLNLASAVQIIAYELRMYALQAESAVDTKSDAAKVAPRMLTPRQQRQQAADSAQRSGYIEHLQEVLEQLEFIHAKPPTMLMRKLTRLYNKAQLTVEEVQILRGILTAMQTHMQRSSEKN